MDKTNSKELERVSEVNKGTSTRPAPRRWRVSMGPSGQTTGRPSSGLKTLPASSGKGISSNR